MFTNHARVVYDGVVVELTLAVVLVVAVVTAFALAARDSGARGRYWAQIGDILADESLTDDERHRALESQYAARPF